VRILDKTAPAVATVVAQREIASMLSLAFLAFRMLGLDLRSRSRNRARRVNRRLQITADGQGRGNHPSRVGAEVSLLEQRCLLSGAWWSTSNVKFED
jgi:hypothetical protein